MNLLRVKIDHGDKLTFMMRQRFIRWRYCQYGSTMDDCLWVSCDVPRCYTCRLTHNQKHNNNTSNYLADIR